MYQHQQSSSRVNIGTTLNQTQEDSLLGIVQSQILERAAKNYLQSGRFHSLNSQFKINNNDLLGVPYRLCKLRIHLVNKCIEPSADLTREDAISLDWTFGNAVVVQAMELVDREFVSILKSPSEKVIMSVRGSTENENYWIIPGSSVCQCRSFVIGIRPICKHIIAAHFALTTNEFESISDDEVKNVYKKYFKDCNFTS